FHQRTLDPIRRYTTFDQWRPDFDLVDELGQRGLFRESGRVTTEARPFRQSVDEYVESFHARASLSWGRMDPDADKKERARQKWRAESALLWAVSARAGRSPTPPSAASPISTARLQAPPAEQPPGPRETDPRQ